MRKIHPMLLVVAMLAAANGCGSDQPGDERRPTEAEKRQALQESAFGSMTGTMDRAHEVESVQKGRKDKLDAAIRETD